MSFDAFSQYTGIIKYARNIQSLGNNIPHGGHGVLYSFFSIGKLAHKGISHGGGCAFSFFSDTIPELGHGIFGQKTFAAHVFELFYGYSHFFR